MESKTNGGNRLSFTSLHSPSPILFFIYKQLTKNVNINLCSRFMNSIKPFHLSLLNFFSSPGPFYNSFSRRENKFFLLKIDSWPIFSYSLYRAYFKTIDFGIIRITYWIISENEKSVCLFLCGEGKSFLKCFCLFLG